MIFWIMLIWVIAIGFVQPKMSKTTLEGQNTNSEKVSWGYCILLWSVPLFFICMCTSFGDKAGYLGSFRSSPLNFAELESYISTWEKSSLYYWLQGAVKIIFLKNEYIWYSIIAIIQAVCVTITLRKYSADFAMSMFIFTASTLMISWMCNGIRQFIIVAVLFACTDWIIKGKWIRYFLVVLAFSGIAPLAKMIGTNHVSVLLGGFHQSALLMIPIFFCIRGKALNKRLWIISSIMLLFLAFGLLDGFLSNTAYGKDLSDKAYQTGANPLRLLVSLAPVALVLIRGKDIINNEHPPIIDLAINTSIVTAMLYAVSTLTSGEFIGRLPIYTELYNLILIPWLIEKVYISHNQWIKIGLYAGYIGYFFYQINIAWATSSYQSSLLGIY